MLLYQVMESRFEREAGVWRGGRSVRGRQECEGEAGV